MCLSLGFELPRPPQVSPQSEPRVGGWVTGSSAACSVCHRNADAAAVHPGDPHQDSHVPDQTQDGLHTHRRRRKVRHRELFESLTERLNEAVALK